MYKQGNMNKFFDVLDELHKQAAVPFEESTTIPPEMYWNEEIFELENEKIFSKDWVCVAREEQIPNVGDYVSVDVANEPLLIVRDKEKNIRALSRLCKHRFADLLGGNTPDSEKYCGNRDSFECPYHAWIYRLDGSLMNAPGNRKLQNFDASCVKLNTFKVAVWQGFIFVNLDNDSDIELDLGLLEELQENQYDFNEWRIAKWVDWGYSGANWKIMIENFSEGYHHLGLHKHTANGIWPENLIEVGEIDDDQWMYGRLFAGNKSGGEEEDGMIMQPLLFDPQPGLSPYLRSQSILFARFPQFLILFGPDLAYWFYMEPRGAKGHYLKVALMVPKDNLDDPRFGERVEEAEKFFRAFQGEDVTINEPLQMYTKSKEMTGGFYHELERPIWQLKKYVSRMLKN